MYADLHVELNTKSPAQVLGVLLNHESVSEDAFRNLSLSEEINGLVIKKYGLPEEFLAPLEDSEHGNELQRVCKLIQDDDIAENSVIKQDFVNDLLDVLNSLSVTDKMKALSEHRPSIAMSQLSPRAETDRSQLEQKL